MHRRIRTTAVEDGEQEVSVADVALFERAPPHELGMSGPEIVHDDRQPASRAETLTAMTADIAGASAYEYCVHQMDLLE
jgi:hypothetical protein